MVVLFYFACAAVGWAVAAFFTAVVWNRFNPDYMHYPIRDLLGIEVKDVQ